MRADYDSEARAISIDLVDGARWEHCEEVADRVNVAIVEGRPVNVELLAAASDAEGRLRIVAERYDLDPEELIAAARAALAAPDRAVTVDVAVRAAA